MLVGFAIYNQLMKKNYFLNAERGWIGVFVKGSLRRAITVHALSSHKQRLVHVVPFNSMLNLVGPDWLGSRSC